MNWIFSLEAAGAVRGLGISGRRTDCGTGSLTLDSLGLRAREVVLGL